MIITNFTTDPMVSKCLSKIIDDANIIDDGVSNSEAYRALNMLRRKYKLRVNFRNDDIDDDMLFIEVDDDMYSFILMKFYNES